MRLGHTEKVISTHIRYKGKQCRSPRQMFNLQYLLLILSDKFRYIHDQIIHTVYVNYAIMLITIYLYIAMNVTYHQVYSKSNTTCTTRGAGTTVCPFDAHELIPDFQWGSCCTILSFL
jgi:ferredoxin